MGEAKRRRAELDASRQQREQEHAAWLAGLATTERRIADVALRLHRNFIVPKRFMGGCYLLAFFLRRYLQREHGIQARAVVGYACDETTPLQMSHAWLDYEGKKTDVSLTITEFPEIQLPGELLVLDRVLSRGVASYTYHLEESEGSQRRARELCSQSPRDAALYAMKAREHAEMLARADDDNAIEAWWRQAPPPLQYESLAAAVRRS